MKFVKFILTIVIIEIIALYMINLNQPIMQERISHASFFIVDSNEREELLLDFQTKIEDNFAKNTINTVIKQRNGHYIIDFETLTENEKVTTFLLNLIENPPKEIHLSRFISESKIDAKKTYLLTLLFIFIPIFLIWYHYVNPKEKKIPQINYKKMFSYLFIILLVLFSSNYIVTHILHNLGYDLSNNPQGLNQLINNNVFFAFIIIVILAPIVEELVFRGLIFRFFMTKNLVVIGSIIVSIEFSFMHYYVLQLNTSLQTKIMIMSSLFILSLSLCWIYQKINNIIAPIALHSLNNLLALVLTYLWVK